MRFIGLLCRVFIVALVLAAAWFGWWLLAHRPDRRIELPNCEGLLYLHSTSDRAI
jgi:hypothetical protein